MISKRWLNCLVVLVGIVASGVVAQAQAGDRADVVMQLIPGEVYSGERFKAVIQMRNSGTTTWSRAGGYRLEPETSGTWPAKRLELEADAHIAPGETATFSTHFTAPETGGAYAFQWYMSHNGTPFGEKTPLIELEVDDRALSRDDAEFVYQDVSQVMLVGEPHEATIQYKNTGRTAWRSGEVSLISPDSEGLVWAIDSVELSPEEVVEPGEFVVFRFNVQAPSEPGYYRFQWQLHHVRDGLFGPPSEGLVIDVR